MWRHSDIFAVAVLKQKVKAQLGVKRSACQCAKVKISRHPWHDVIVSCCGQQTLRILVGSKTDLEIHWK